MRRLTPLLFRNASTTTKLSWRPPPPELHRPIVPLPLPLLAVQKEEQSPCLIAPVSSSLPRAQRSRRLKHRAPSELCPPAAEARAIPCLHRCSFKSGLLRLSSPAGKHTPTIPSPPSLGFLPHLQPPPTGRPSIWNGQEFSPLNR
jgi:hypothetical protein